MKLLPALFCLLLPLIAHAQPSTSKPETADPTPTLTGKQILKQAVDAAGGDAWQSPKTLELRGDAVWTPYGRTDAANQLRFDDYALYRIFPADNDAARQANGKVRIDAKAAKVPFLQLIFDGKNTHNYLSDQAKPYQKHFSWSNNFGFSILRFADREGFTVERLADDQIEGIPCYVVQITDPKKFITTFLIDQTSKYIRSVAFTTEIGFHHRIYSDFKRAPNVNFIQPTRLRLYFDGIKWMDINWRQFRVNEVIADSVFVKE